MNYSRPSDASTKNEPSGTYPYMQHTVPLSPARSTTSSLTEGSVITPPPAAYSTPQQAREARLAEFFGGRKQSTPKLASPPPYQTSRESLDTLPTYEASAEPSTLARFMFWYGFFFPPFWIMGIIILCSELRPAPSWELGKSEAEKSRIMTEMRTTEVKWAKRCVWALMTLIVAIALIVVVVIFGRRH